ncbi:MAG: glutamate--tRNA ligase [Euryarchaeota archaeon]|nr:glutamate--tRNA ligase [Euryarchaeota archaeon]
MEADETRELIEKYALQNAVKYGKAPKAGAVLGKVLGEHPDLRKAAKEVAPLVNEVLSGLKGDPEIWAQRLREIAPELIDEIGERKEPATGLPDLDLEAGDGGKVVLRFAPNPNGPATIGSVRGIVVNAEYARRHGGEFVLRFDDTDPKTKPPMLEAYLWYLDDCEYLGAVPDRVVYASDHIPEYYEYAEKLILLDKAYVCFCKRDEFKRYKDAGEACPHRDADIVTNLECWKRMLNREYAEGEVVLRIKTDITHKDPALRDWAAFRIVETPHPRAEVGGRFCVWPLLDFESAVEDHLLGITHIIRGKDLMDSELRQRYIYDYLGWQYPKTMHWGRMKVHEFGKFSTSAISHAIAGGTYTGWDDPRVPTLRALRRRGISSEAIRKFMIDLGVGETDISLSLDTLYAINRKVIDPVSNRYFFVWDPVAVEILDAARMVATPKQHPDHDDLREIPAGSRVFLCGEDARNMKPGDRLRMKNLYDIEIVDMELPTPTVKRIGTAAQEWCAIEEKPRYRIIHWVPDMQDKYLRVTVRAPDQVYEGFGEAGIASELGNTVQFERFGFVRIDSVDVKNRSVVAYFTHR